jgi:hypothetical protein
MPNPLGRPRGSKNAPNPLREALKEANPARIPRKRAPQEEFQGTKYISSLKLDAVSHACLTIHANRRHVPLAWLVQDVLNLWLAAVTDYDQAIFKEMLPPNARAGRCPERYAGYHESLGFQEVPQAPIAAPQAAPIPAAVASVPAMPPQEKTLADLSTPYRHPSTQGPASYPHPQPTLPQNAALFDSREAVNLKPGMGNAAQQATEGGMPDATQPPLPAEVEKYLEHYKVKPEDVR